MNAFEELHPDDILDFQEIVSAMREVAKLYNLPLQSVKPLPMPKSEMADRMGDCSHDGHIRLVMRCTVNGQWCDAPMSPTEVWETAAHELAHLRHFNHGTAFDEFRLELQEALRNRKPDHKQKILEKLVKIQRLRESEAELGNIEAAESFAGMINKMLIDYELQPSDIDYVRATDKDPVIELRVDWKMHMKPGEKNPKKFEPARHRIAWQESLARIVANAHLCQFLVSKSSDTIWFVGTKSHATVAEYVYSTLVLSTHEMAKRATVLYARQCRREGQSWKAKGYRQGWYTGFVSRIAERFEIARKEAVKGAASDVPGGESQALMRLNGALVKVQKYVDDKFQGRPGIEGLSAHFRHADGTQHGRAAADSITLGRRGVGGNAVKGHLDK